MPSYLHDFYGGATNREQKFIRAVRSIVEQTYREFELIIIADGCKKTDRILHSNFSISNLFRIKFIEIKKQPKFSGTPRNEGLKAARGQQMLYMDTDDCAGKEHLQTIHSQLTDQPWHFFNDWVGDKDSNFKVRYCSPQIKGQCGTSNICHRKDSLVEWPDGYAHDWQFIQKLMKISNPVFLRTVPHYYVCHIPKQIDI